MEENTDEFDRVIKHCFNLLLPSGGTSLYQTVYYPFDDKTYVVDGRKVIIKQTDIGVMVEIWDL